MLYTFLGLLIGFFISYVIAAVSGMDLTDGHGFMRFPGTGQMFVMVCTLIGMGIGFGVGATRFAEGRYLPRF